MFGSICFGVGDGKFDGVCDAGCIEHLHEKREGEAMSLNFFASRKKKRARGA